MKKPLFTESERAALKHNNNLLADRIKLNIAILKFKREFIKSPLGKFIKYLATH